MQSMSKNEERRAYYITGIRKTHLLLLLGMGLVLYGLGKVQYGLCEQPLVFIGIPLVFLVFMLLFTLIITPTHIISLLPLWRIPLAGTQLITVTDPAAADPTRVVTAAVYDGRRCVPIACRYLPNAKWEKILARLRASCREERGETLSFTLMGYTRPNMRALVSRLLSLLLLGLTVAVMLYRTHPHYTPAVRHAAQQLGSDPAEIEPAWNDADSASAVGSMIITHAMRKRHTLIEEAAWRARPWYERAACLGDPVAKVLQAYATRATYILPTPEVQQLAAEGFRELEKAMAERGLDDLYTEEVEALIICYRHGIGTEKDETKAHELLQNLNDEPTGILQLEDFFIPPDLNKKEEQD